MQFEGTFGAMLGYFQGQKKFIVTWGHAKKGGPLLTEKSYLSPVGRETDFGGASVSIVVLGKWEK